MPSTDAQYMREAVRLGRKELGRTSPNPPVGAVVVSRGRVVGRGYHRGPGQPHGEIEALRQAGGRSRGATLYVTLEPCNHHGRTPPCADAILAAGVRRVVFGARDPNPHVRGGGAARLRRRGIAVETGVEADACAELVAGFTSLVTRARPLVTLKLATSLDGRLATRSGASRWISAAPARELVHRWRDEHDAVMVGAGTVLADDPALTCRRRGGRDPLRVIVDGRLRVPLRAQIVSGRLAAGTVIATAVRRGRKLGALRARGVQVLTLPGRNGSISLPLLFQRLAKQGVSSVLLEGGAGLAAAAVRAGMVDRVSLFLAPKLIGGDGVPMMGGLGVASPERAPQLRITEVSRVGVDLLVRAELLSRTPAAAATNRHGTDTARG
jgi:diaminohydroxyphosphoribosylaminopyrimidine deaminase/5-amino-6-(5-phosphoribosylamino)uracil reductase